MGAHPVNLAVRFLLELAALLAALIPVTAAVFGVGIWALKDSGFTRTSFALGTVVIVLSYDRIVWLLDR